MVVLLKAYKINFIGLPEPSHNYIFLTAASRLTKYSINVAEWV